MANDNMPKIPLLFLRWFCKRDLIDEIEGDLIEAYRQRSRFGAARAKWRFFKEVLQSFNSRNIGIMEKYEGWSLIRNLSILKQYGRVLMRTMRKSKIYTTISIASLTLGIACAGLIYLYLQKELTFDQVFSRYTDIYRINHHSKNSGRSYGYAPLAMTPHLVDNLDAVESGTRIFKYRRAIPMTVVSTRQSFNEGRFGWSDPTFFHLFDLPLIQGSPQTVLLRPNVVVISASTAKKYFGDRNPIGEIIEFNWGENTPLEVTGVFEDFPSNASIQLDLISNIETCRNTMWSGGRFSDWRNMFVSAYILLKPGIDINSVQEVQQVAQQATSKYYTPDNPDAWTTSIQPLINIHLDPPLTIGEWSKHNDSETLILFAAIGLIILSLGCFNFTNMVTAQAGQRTKEVGVRKVLGSQRRQIAQQTLFETLIFVLISGMFALLLVYGLLPKLGALTSHRYGLQDLVNLNFLAPFTLILLLVAAIAGAYPALYISRIQSLQLMKNNSGVSGGKTVRNVLVTAQFTITTGLVICTLMVYLQLQFLQKKELGFNQSVIVNMPIHNDDAVIPKIDAFRNEVTAQPGISHVTAASHEMFSDYTYIADFKVEGLEEEHKWERYTVEQDYISTFDLDIIAGRGFDATIPSDCTAFVLNESAVKALGLTLEEAVNRTITDQGLEKTGKIVGIAKDFHFRSLHHTIQPFVMYVNWDRLDYISVRLESNNFSENIARLEAGWYRIFGESVPFFYSFLDQQAADLYQSEDNERQLFTLFSVVSIVLGCLGLFGFALFTTERKFKEIGLRKVLGAGTWQVILMINQNFIRILSLAFALATPAAFYLMRNWLQAFAYRIDQPVWVYLVTGAATFLIATITVSYLSWKAASSNPVDAIKVE